MLRNLKIPLQRHVAKSSLSDGSRHREALQTTAPSRCPKASQEQTATRTEIRSATLLLETWSSARNQTYRMRISTASCSLPALRFLATVADAPRHEPCGVCIRCASRPGYSIPRSHICNMQNGLSTDCFHLGLLVGPSSWGCRIMSDHNTWSDHDLFSL